MNKKTSLNKDTNAYRHRKHQNQFTFSWILYHGLILTAFVTGLFFTKGIKIDSDFTTMIPSSHNSEAARIAEKSISKNATKSVFILASHPEFEKAKQAAEEAYNCLKDSDKFESISLYQDFSSSTEILDFLGTYRWQLLSDDMQKQLSDENGLQDFSEQSLSKVFSGFTITGLDNLDKDPFLLDEINLTQALAAVSDAGTALSPKDGVLASKYEDRWYVMIRGTLTPLGAKLASDENAVPLIYDVCFPLEKDNVSFCFYGTPFHSYKSSTSASSEISAISTVSMLIVLIILLFIFKSPIPVLSSLASILISLGTAFCATHFVFSNLHVITLIFGTSLIGSSIDYSLHYFINWKANPKLTSSKKIRKHIFAGLILSLISTEICYTMLMGAPFTMLKQIAVFSFTGILSSFLTSVGLFPLFKVQHHNTRHIPLYETLNTRLLKYTQKSNFKKTAVLLQIALFILLSSIIAIKHSDVKIQNNVANLYEVDGRLKEDTITAYNVINYSPSSYLIINGDTIQSVLETEELLCPLLTDPYVCTARFIPSKQSQVNSLHTAESLLPYAQQLLSYYGYEDDKYQAITEGISSAYENILTPESTIPQTLKSLLNITWIGNIDNQYYSIILPSKITDESFYVDLAQKYDNVHFINRTKDTNESLDKLTKLIITMFCISFVIIIILMKFFYSWQDTLKIATIPVLSIMMILSVFTLAGLKIEFFCITGIILVFGLGLDYVIYKLENKNNSLETFAIALSFVTTAISFGALTLSSFIPIHVMGLSIFSGLIVAFFSAIL